MKRMRLLFLVVLVASTPAQAEIMAAALLEWLADHCPDSGIYEVSRVKKKEHLTNSYKISLTLKRSLRGNPPKTTVESYYPSKRVDPKSPSVKEGDRFLIAFQHYNTGEVRSVQLINLTNPGLGFPTFIAVSCQLKLLKSEAGILQVFEGRLKSHPKGDPVEISDYSKDNRFELEGHTEVFSAIYAGSTCYLRVPNDLVEKVRVESQRQEQEANKALHSDAVNRARER